MHDSTARASRVPSDGAGAGREPFGGQHRPRSKPPATRPTGSWSPRENSESGHPLGVIGPQVGYYIPQILSKRTFMGPASTLGAALPGVNLFVQLGHGRHYAWSATTADSDNVDTFAEVLCKDRLPLHVQGQVPGDGKARAAPGMDADRRPDPAGEQTLTAYRTVHGIVFARGKVHGMKVAFVHERSTYFHEADSVIGFAELNEPGVVTGVKGFKKAVYDISFLFNWSYIDADHIAYALSGAMPQRPRAPRRLPDLRHRPVRLEGLRSEDPDGGMAAVFETPAGGRSGNARLLEQQAGARMGGGRRPVRLGPIHRAADDRRPRHAATSRGSKEDVDLAAGAGDGGTGDRGPARPTRLLPIILQGDRQAEVHPQLRGSTGDAHALAPRTALAARDLDRDSEAGRGNAAGMRKLMDAWWPPLVERRVQADAR